MRSLSLSAARDPSAVATAIATAIAIAIAIAMAADKRHYYHRKAPLHTMSADKMAAGKMGADRKWAAVDKKRKK